MKISKIKQKHWVLTIEFSETMVVNGEATTNTSTTNYEHLAHPDFREAFDKLKPFMCDLSDQVLLDDNKVNRYASISFINDDYKGYNALSISLEGEEYSRKISIGGTRELRDQKMLAITTPKRKIFDDVEKYNYAEQLNEVIKQIIEEAEQYIAGKAAAEQLDLFDGEEGEESEQGEEAA
jgi:hypothetical protein